jgi:hypothetical protein
MHEISSILSSNVFASAEMDNRHKDWNKQVRMRTTWKPQEKHGRLTVESDLPDSAYAFPDQRKEPLTDVQHVRSAVARFDQVIDVSDADRALAFANIKEAAKYYNVGLSETSWQEVGVHPQQNRDKAAAKGVATKRERGELQEAAAKGAATRKREHEDHG